jgi:hypothetical protein
MHDACGKNFLTTLKSEKSMQNSDGAKNEKCMRCQLHRMHDACGVNDTACTMHAISLTPHAKYDTIDE